MLEFDYPIIAYWIIVWCAVHLAMLMLEIICWLLVASLLRNLVCAVMILSGWTTMNCGRSNFLKNVWLVWDLVLVTLLLRVCSDVATAFLLRLGC